MTLFLFASAFGSINPRTRTSLHLLVPSKSMSWSCKQCTFINPPSQKSICNICLSPSSPAPLPSSSSSSVPKWSCKACTFMNPYNNSNCSMCSTRSPVSSLTNLDDLNDTGLDGDIDSSVGSVFLPLRACKRTVRDPVEQTAKCTESSQFRGAKSSRVRDDCVELEGIQEIKPSNKAVTQNDTKSQSELKILSYNVWFREDVELHKRMKAIGELIQQHLPDIICFQEVTPNIFDIFQRSGWWSIYQCSISKDIAYSRPYFCIQLSKLQVKSLSSKPFKNSIMGRELCAMEVEVEGNKRLVVATSHLESPSPGPPTWDQMYSKERVEQANAAIDILKKKPNVIFCGDMNWDEKWDDQFPLPGGWVDAWVELRRGENGWTYDTKANQMLTGNRTLQKRLDRFVCSLRDFKINVIDMIGLEPIPGLSYIKEKKVNKEIRKLELPVLPSDHYGLLLTIQIQ